MFCPFLRPALPVLAILAFLSGCDKQLEVKIGNTAPVISSNDIHGEFFSLDQHRGKVVVIYFWTNSCCGDSLKLLEPVYSKNKYNGLEIVAINENDSKKDVESYAANNRLTFTMLTDEHSLLFRQYQVIGFPTIFIIDGKGVIREKILGNIDTAKLEKLIQRQFDIKKAMEINYEKTHPR